MNSIPYQLSQAVVAALQAADSLAGATVRDNPTDPASLREGSRIVFVEDQDDAPSGDQSGQAELRTFRLSVGVINRTEADRSGADEDMQAAKTVTVLALFDAARALRQSSQIETFNAPTEGRRSYRVEGIDVGGALILTDLSIQYRTPPAITRRTK